VDRAIPHILLDWLNKIPGLSKVDNHSWVGISQNPPVYQTKLTTSS
jgi:hypothetical protein